MRYLLIESYGKHDKPLNWLIGRLDNWRFAAFTATIKKDPHFYQKNAHLWRKENDDLIGFFISENGKEYFELQIHPEYRFLEEEMLQWCIDNWAQGKDQITTIFYKYDTTRIKLFEKYNFEYQGVVGYDYRYDTKNYTKGVAINSNFHFAAFSEGYDYENRIETERLTFARDSLNREWFETKALAPGYSSDWDLAIVSPTGQVVAFCLAWLDQKNNVAEIDPVGTHPDYRKRGFAQALLTECFVRLHNHGITKAQIIGFSEPANKLYTSLMPAQKYELLKYRLKL
jgi:ribosomal protein S18 acetylase RimI-like enzyme